MKNNFSHQVANTDVRQRSKAFIHIQVMPAVVFLDFYNIYQYFQPQLTHPLYEQSYYVANSSTLNAGHHLVVMKEYKCV
jgi:hypothetical protein